MPVGFAAILPLFLLIALGYVAKRTVLDIKLLPGLNLFAYYFAVPALLFDAARQQSIHDLVNPPALAAVTLAIFATTLFTYLLFRVVFPANNEKTAPSAHPTASKNQTSIIQCLTSVFSNYAYMGIPLTFGLLGESAYGATISIVILGNLLIINGAQLLLETLNHNALDVKTVFNILQRSLIQNPIFMSTVLGLVFSSFTLELTQSLQTVIDLLAPSAIPVALFCLGASLQFRKTKTGYGQIFSLVGIKLVLHPLLTLACFYLLGIEDSSWLLVAVLMCALPTGALAHVVALKHQVYDTETSQVIVFSTLFSLLSVSVWVQLLI